LLASISCIGLSTHVHVVSQIVAGKILPLQIDSIGGDKLLIKYISNRAASISDSIFSHSCCQSSILSNIGVGQRNHFLDQLILINSIWKVQINCILLFIYNTHPNLNIGISGLHCCLTSCFCCVIHCIWISQNRCNQST